MGIQGSEMTLDNFKKLYLNHKWTQIEKSSLTWNAKYFTKLLTTPRNPLVINNIRFPFGKGDSSFHCDRLIGWAISQIYRNLKQLSVTGLMSLRCFTKAFDEHMNKLLKKHTPMPKNEFKKVSMLPFLLTELLKVSSFIQFDYQTKSIHNTAN